jgi:hypothetical protein
MMVSALAPSRFKKSSGYPTLFGRAAQIVMFVSIVV